MRTSDLPRHRPLVHGRFHQGFGYATATTLEWLTSGRTYGIPHTFIFLLIVAAIMGVVLHKSVFGRYLFAVGKNEEAARFSGIHDHAGHHGRLRHRPDSSPGSPSVFFVFYTQSVSPSAHGNFYELYAIAAAVLGGCSLRGGEGSIVGIVLGTVLLQVLQNLVNILGIPCSLNFAVMGAVILLGVIADRQLQAGASTSSHWSVPRPAVWRGARPARLPDPTLAGRAARCRSTRATTAGGCSTAPTGPSRAA